MNPIAKGSFYFCPCRELSSGCRLRGLSAFKKTAAGRNGKSPPCSTFTLLLCLGRSIFYGGLVSLPVKKAEASEKRSRGSRESI